MLKVLIAIIVIIALTILIVKLIDKFGINYPVLLAEPAVTRNFGGVTGIPVTFLVNRQGQIVKKYLGYVSHDDLEEEIKTMLAAG